MTDFIDVRTLPGTAVTDVVRDQGYFPVIAGLAAPSASSRCAAAPATSA